MFGWMPDTASAQAALGQVVRPSQGSGQPFQTFAVFGNGVSCFLRAGGNS